MFVGVFLTCSSVASASSNSLTPHDPIYIEGNSDFSDDDNDGVINPGATGTENNPYIIENWIIDASSDDGIWIEDTTLHFVVRNCVIEKGGSSYNGIHLKNITNGGIENNRFDANYRGVFLRESTNNTIKNNTVENSSLVGIFLGSISKHNTIENNVVRNSDGTGIGVNGARTEWNIIENNTVKNGSRFGINLNPSYHNTVKNNAVENYKIGIRSWTVMGLAGKYHTIENNTCKNNSIGILLHESSNNTIVNNTCSNNENGIMLTGDPDTGYSNNNVLYHNLIYSNNQFNAFDEGHNTWENIALKEGNYWSDWQPPEHADPNNDGIVDEPRPIEGGNNYDNYPLVIGEKKPVEWNAHLRATAIGAEVNDNSILGVRENASEELDPYDVYPEPPTGPGVSVRNYFHYPKLSQTDLQGSFYPPDNVLEWPLTIEFEDSEDNIVLDWDVSEIPKEYRMVQLLDNSGNVLVDNLRGADNYHFEAGSGTYEFSIRVAKLIPFTIELQEGWDLVSLPVAPQDPSAGAIFPNKTIFGWTGRGYRWIEEGDGLKASRGYWVYSDAPENIKILGTLAPKIISLLEGWNLVGIPRLKPIRKGRLLAGKTIFGWTGRGYRWIRTEDDLSPGNGYWVYSEVTENVPIP